MRRVVLAAALIGTAHLGAQTPPSDLRLSPLFSDHMVVQRDVTIPVWGWAPPRARVTVKLDDRAASTTADSTGRSAHEIGILNCRMAESCADAISCAAFAP